MERLIRGATQCRQALLVFTVRIQRMRESNIFTLCVSPHLDPGGGGGGWYPFPGPAGPPPPGPGKGYPHCLDLGREYPPPHLDLGRGYPHPRLDGVSPTWTWEGGTPPSKTEWGTPRQETEQHSKHLLPSRWYASCIYTGGVFLVMFFSRTCC